LKGAEVVNGNGAVDLDAVEGDTYVKTSFGSIDVNGVKGKFTAQNSNGSVTARRIAGDAGVDTSFSGVTLEGVGGSVHVNNQNGAIEVTAAAATCHDISLRTSFSEIVARIPAAGGYRVNAKTSFGHINSDLPITATGTLGGDSLSGTIGSGSCALELTNSNGNIQISRAP